MFWDCFGSLLGDLWPWNEFWGVGLNCWFWSAFLQGTGFSADRSTGRYCGRPVRAVDRNSRSRPVVEAVDQSVFQQGKLVSNLLLHYIYTHITSSSSFLTPDQRPKPHSSSSSPPTLFLRSPATGCFSGETPAIKVSSFREGYAWLPSDRSGAHYFKFSNLS